MSLEKLIKEYQAKKSAERQTIVRLTQELSEARSANNQAKSEIAAEDRRAANIKEQAYIQFVRDLEDLQEVK